MLSILDKTYNEGIEIAAKEAEAHALSLRSMNGESEEWVWPAANSCDGLVKRIRALKRVE